MPPRTLSEDARRLRTAVRLDEKAQILFDALADTLGGASRDELKSSGLAVTLLDIATSPQDTFDVGGVQKAFPAGTVLTVDPGCRCRSTINRRTAPHLRGEGADRGPRKLRSSQGKSSRNRRADVLNHQELQSSTLLYR